MKLSKACGINNEVSIMLCDFDYLMDSWQGNLFDLDSRNTQKKTEVLVAWHCSKGSDIASAESILFTVVMYMPSEELRQSVEM